MIDLVLCTTDLFDCIHKFTVHGANILSDHCCVSFAIKCRPACNINITTDNNFINENKDDCEKLSHMYKWDRKIV